MKNMEHTHTQTQINLRTVKWAQCDKTQSNRCASSGVNSNRKTNGRARTEHQHHINVDETNEKEQQ